MSYYTLKESYTSNKFLDQTPVDNFPFYNKWRNNPLSDDSIIRANVAGYYPYNKQMIQQQPPAPTPPPVVTYPSETILLKDYPITYPSFTIRNKASDLMKGTDYYQVNISP